VADDVTLTPALRERLGLPANADSRAIYEALIALTEDKPLTVRFAAPNELSAVDANGRKAALIALEAGDVKLFMRYDLERDNIGFITDQPQAPKAIAVAQSGAPTQAKVVHLAPIRFDFDQAKLDRAGFDRLQQEGFPKVADVRKVRYVIRGHADEVGTRAYNERLSRERADAVRDFLVAKGADPANVEVLAFGSTVPQTHCPPRMDRKLLLACLAPNRRVEVDIQLP
jgi:outer membrane protein OmpA-like peptidoglycan-associated protein